MKKAHLVGIYISVVMTILTLNRLFIMSGFEPGEDPAPRRGAPQKPLLNEAQAVSPPSPLQRDPDLVKNWALKDDSALSIHKAWQLGQCDERVVVAVIDTGVDYNHPDLKQNIWKNPVEIEGNGKDDDKNGYVDDTMGWDFVGNDPLPYDDHGHGTHVTGIIGAASSNGIGISGVCPNVRLMILKYYDADADGKTNLKNTVRALHYAVDNGAN
ncbi:MAG: S8 family serine peptidase, partial [Deltaproteobacteria bacterium]